MTEAPRPHRVARWLAPLVVALSLLVAPVRAEEADPAAPRAMLEIGGVSVVLIVANGKLHAFADRLEDNAPSIATTLGITMADGKPVSMTRVSDGLFVAPFDPGSRKRDSLLVSVSGSDGAGDAMAEVVYGARGEVTADAGDGLRGKVLIAIVAGLIGLLLGSVIMRRRGTSQAPARTA